MEATQPAGPEAGERGRRPEPCESERGAGGGGSAPQGRGEARRARAALGQRGGPVGGGGAGRDAALPLRGRCPGGPRWPGRRSWHCLTAGERRGAAARPEGGAAGGARWSDRRRPLRRSREEEEEEGGEGGREAGRWLGSQEQKPGCGSGGAWPSPSSFVAASQPGLGRLRGPLGELSKVRDGTGPAPGRAPRPPPPFPGSSRPCPGRLAPCRRQPACGGQGGRRRRREGRSGRLPPPPPSPPRGWGCG